MLNFKNFIINFISRLYFLIIQFALVFLQLLFIINKFSNFFNLFLITDYNFLHFLYHFFIFKTIIHQIIPNFIL